MARRNKYDDVIKPNLSNIQHWVSEGYSHKQIYQKLNVSETIFYKYLSSKTEFKEAVNRGNVFLQVPLEKALYKEAAGFTYVEKHVEFSEEELPNGKKITKKKQKQVTKFARANASLLMFALCNKFPEKWKRVDKEDIPDEEKDVIDLNITDEHIKAGFEAMYPAIEKEDIKKLESKQKESVKNGKDED